MKFNNIPEIIKDIQKGRIVIVVDDEDRENEGDLVVAASFSTPETINFMAKHGRGLICLPMEEERLEQLEIYPMVKSNQTRFRTGWAVSVDAKRGVTTGISAYDRALTIKTMLDAKTNPEDIVRPGHVFPLIAKDGGVLVRSGHTEAAVDLAKLAGLYPAGVICEIMSDDGTMARLPQLIKFAQKHKLKICTIKDLIKFRRKSEKLVKRIETTTIPTDFGKFRLALYNSIIDSSSHIALIRGKLNSDTPILVRVHSQCLTGDVFGSLRCDCGVQLSKAMKLIEDEGRGVILYMRQEGRGIGLTNKIRAYALQDKGLDTVEANTALGFDADLRDYGIGAQILVDLGIKRIKLLTNNPKKIVGLEGYGLEVIESISLETEPTPMNTRYLKTKKQKLGHRLKRV